MATTLQVILQSDVPNLGASGELVKVRPGFARNFLLPRKLAVPATTAQVNRLNHEKAVAVARAEKNKKEGVDFLAANKGKPGVKTTASGLQYTVEKEGTGPKPKATDTVKVHYLGTKIDGTEFDSSIKRGQPAKFPLANVIPGWTEGLQLMPVGSEYKFFIPAKLAYGEHGPPQIGPDATLIFDVTLISIDKPEAAKPAAPAAPKKD